MELVSKVFTRLLAVILVFCFCYYAYVFNAFVPCTPTPLRDSSLATIREGNAGVVAQFPPELVLRAAEHHRDSKPFALDWWYANTSKNWLDAIVVPQHRLIFCSIAKVGSSGFRRLLRWLSGDPAWHEQPYFINKSTGLTSNLMQLAHMPRKEAFQLLANDTWTKLVVVRDPFDRLISAYSDKIAKGYDLNYKPILAKKLYGLSVNSFATTSFEDFFARVELGMMEDLEHEDQHWKRQSEICGLERFLPLYTKVLYMPHNKSKHDRLVQEVLNLVAARSPKPFNVSMFEWPQAAKTSIQGHTSNHTVALITAEMCHKALRLYAADYELFGLPRPICLDRFPFVKWSE